MFVTCSVWVALDAADERSGCLWMVPGSQHRYVEHARVKAGHHTISVTDETRRGCEARAVAYPVAAGGAVLNTGRTLHCSKRNGSQRPRRAYILNFRPRDMIRLEREQGFDHGKGGLHNLQKKG